MKYSLSKLGIMQGRLSPIIDNKIQAFPIKNWKSEFPAMAKLGIMNLEWTLDQHNLDLNPLLSVRGKQEIRELCNTYDTKIIAVTCDNFMQAPFFLEESKTEYQKRIDEIKQVLEACVDLGIERCVLPVVDNSSIKTEASYNAFVNEIGALSDLIKNEATCISVECDFAPEDVKKLMNDINNPKVGVNYDTGNSASLGFSPNEEFKAYGKHITHVHLKDRKLKGLTVPLGEGHTNFVEVFNCLKSVNYQGYFVLQAARSPNDDHLGQIAKYKEFLREYMQ